MLLAGTPPRHEIEHPVGLHMSAKDQVIYTFPGPLDILQWLLGQGTKDSQDHHDEFQFLKSKLATNGRLARSDELTSDAAQISAEYDTKLTVFRRKFGGLKDTVRNLEVQDAELSMMGNIQAEHATNWTNTLQRQQSQRPEKRQRLDDHN